MLLLLSGCSQEDENGPPEIVLGRTQCDECKMIIDDLRYAGAFRLTDGTPKRFDDIGDMVAQMARLEGVDEDDAWVFDYETEEPILVRDATFVRGEEIVSPMDWGVVAFLDASSATDFASEVEGETFDWTELKVELAETEDKPGNEEDPNHDHATDH